MVAPSGIRPGLGYCGSLAGGHGVAMTLADVEQLEPGTILWLVTGVFTASRVRLVGVYGSGAVRRPRVEAVDTAPGQPTGAFGVAVGSLRPL